MTTGIIEHVEIRDLFGLFNYRIPESGTLANPSILYGDNGVGKSTVLNLVFHLLSAAGDRGHRTAIWNTPFSYLRVSLKSGYELTACRENGTDDDVIVLSVAYGGKVEAEWNYAKGRREYDYSLSEDVSDIVVEQLLNERTISPTVAYEIRMKKRRPKDDGVRRGERNYLNALEGCSPTIFLVSAERRLESDAISGPTDEMELREVLHNPNGRKMGDLVKRSRQVSLKQALAKASRWVQDKALKSATQGSMNVHSVYEQILGQLSVNYSDDDVVIREDSLERLLENLSDIERDSASYSRYEITGAINVDKLRLALTTGPDQGRLISAKLIDPYVKSVLSRLEAIDPVFRMIDEFVNQINTFLTRKVLKFSMGRGFRIINEIGDSLDESQLSSGEQQLLLMFCYALTAQDQPSIFIVDEPEISLNIKWQRQLLKSLGEITRGTETQFIFASHSLELIAQHRSNVVKIG